MSHLCVVHTDETQPTAALTTEEDSGVCGVAEGFRGAACLPTHTGFTSLLRFLLISCM